jgi:hypothetical protein
MGRDEDIGMIRIEDVLLPSEMVVAIGTGSSPPTKKPRHQRVTTDAFVRVPYPDILKAAAKINSAPLAVLLGVMFEAWRCNSRTIRLSGRPFELAGIGRYTRLRALRRLEDVGFISIARRKGAKPMITLLWQPPE